MIGTVLNKRYRVDALLGEGGMGVVYLGTDTRSDHQVAIKTLSGTIWISHRDCTTVT